MSAHRKSLDLHKLNNTYRPDRHEYRAKKVKITNSLPPPMCPNELPNTVKNIFHWFINTYPGLCEQHAPLIAQASYLYSSFIEEPKQFKTADHNQLRLLLKEIQSVGEVVTDDDEDSDFEKWIKSNH